MVITSMDINNKEFKKNFRGYDCDEVDEFLDKIGEDYETIYKESSFLKERLEIAEEKLKHYSKIEENIQKTLVLAQSAAEQAKSSAQNEAELIIRQANESAQRIINKAHNDVIKINDEYEEVKQEFLKFRAKFKHFMSAQLDTFSGLEREFIKNYSVGNTVDLADIQAKDIQSDINNEVNSTNKINTLKDLGNIHNENIRDISIKKDIEKSEHMDKGIEQDINKDEVHKSEELNEEDLDAIKSFFADEDVK